ncbi:MAG TPA: hypothetical protein VF245_06470 [Solirubrobacterales bacterium]
MKHAKVFGLATIASIGAMVFIGTSTATANSNTIVLCANAELECESPFPNPTTIVAHATNVQLRLVIGTIICEKSLLETTLLNVLANSLVEHFLSLTFEKCNLGKTACTVTVETLGLLTWTKSGALTGNAKSTGGTRFVPICGSLVNCKYGGEPTSPIHSEGGEFKLLATETTILAEEGEKFICPGEMKWIATYSGLGSMWVES